MENFSIFSKIDSKQYEQMDNKILGPHNVKILCEQINI